MTRPRSLFINYREKSDSGFDSKACVLYTLVSPEFLEIPLMKCIAHLKKGGGGGGGNDMAKKEAGSNRKNVKNY